MAAFLFAFYPGASSSALSQVTAAEAGTILAVTLSTDNTFIDAAGSVTLNVTITNLSDQPVRLLKWDTPVEGVEQPLFIVTSDGQPAGYIGKRIKRPAPTDEDYIILAAGESLASRVDLSEYYDFPVTGEYILAYDTALLERALAYNNPGLAKGAGSALSNTLALTIEGRLASLPNELQALTVSGSNSFNGCSASRQTDLINARNAASTYASNAVAYFAANRQGERYTTWFGTYVSNRYSTVAGHFNSIKSALLNASPMHFDCTCTDPYFAYVFPTQPYNIYLCTAFWSAPATGTDSKAGTLVHEISHFNVVADTDDYAYGQTASKNLAISSPALAIMNADNHEYFAENTPPLENDNPSDQTFSDVPLDHTFWNYIEAFYDAGITTGCSQAPMKFCPLANVTRAEMAVFIERAMGNFSPTPNPSGMFTDVPYTGMPVTFRAFIEEFYNDGITTGCGTNPLRYCPQNNVTRQEMAVFIERALGNFAPTPNPTGMFADVPYPGMPITFPAFIEQFYNDGITTGCANNPLRYCPLNNVTRQEMAVFIVRAFDIPLP